MCQFHSFLWQCESGEISDQPGEVHHSAIAVGCGVEQDKFLLPEFRLAERRLDFDGQSWPQVYGSNPRLDGPEWLSGWQNPKWTNRGPDKLNRYLVKHFGTADALMEFVEPQWEQAQRSCIETLKAGVWVPASPPKSSLPELRLDDTMRGWQVNRTSPPPIDITTSSDRVQRYMAIVGMDSFDIRCPVTAIKSLNIGQIFELVVIAKGVESRSGPLGLHGAEAIDGGMACLEAYQSLPIDVEFPPRIEYDEWKGLFREARNRVECWQEDRVEMLV